MHLLHHKVIVTKVKEVGVGVGVMVYHIHLTNQTINNLAKIEGGIVLPDI